MRPGSGFHLPRGHFWHVESPDAPPKFPDGHSLHCCADVTSHPPDEPLLHFVRGICTMHSVAWSIRALSMIAPPSRTVCDLIQLKNRPAPPQLSCHTPLQDRPRVAHAPSAEPSVVYCAGYFQSRHDLFGMTVGATQPAFEAVLGGDA